MRLFMFVLLIVWGFLYVQGRRTEEVRKPNFGPSPSPGADGSGSGGSSGSSGSSG